ncbi:hypothetical protein [Dapis sp. BLCC M172]|uniref:hypothetical protein n=1 Tax=Dapis sp. BLCC M172 TaxID=2975281 RepID=UPI003CEAE53A
MENNQENIMLRSYNAVLTGNHRRCSRVERSPPISLRYFLSNFYIYAIESFVNHLLLILFYPLLIIPYF